MYISTQYVTERISPLAAAFTVGETVAVVGYFLCVYVLNFDWIEDVRMLQSFYIWSSYSFHKTNWTELAEKSPLCAGR